MIRLTQQQVIMLHQDVIAQSGGSPEIRDEGLLDSALNAPFQTFAGMELYPTIIDKSYRQQIQLGHRKTELLFYVIHLTFLKK